jgi:hypothetical protein
MLVKLATAWVRAESVLAIVDNIDGSVSVFFNDISEPLNIMMGASTADEYAQIVNNASTVNYSDT